MGTFRISGDKTFTGDIVFESNVHMNGGNVFVANTVNLTVSDPIIELGSNNLNTGDLGIIMTRHGATNSNIALVFDESDDILRMGYTSNGASNSVISLDSNALAVSVQGALSAASVSGDGSGLTGLNASNITTGALSTTTVTIDDYLIHDGDTDTKIGFPSADTFTVTTANSERLRVDSSGLVGIGTNNPGDMLHVYKNGYTPRVSIETPGAHDAELKLKNSNGQWVFRCLDSSGDLRFNGTTGLKAVITQSATVGIGTQTVDAPLHVFKQQTSGLNGTTDGGGIKLERYANYGCAIWSQLVDNTTDTMSFRVVNNATDAYGGVPQMVLTHTGNLGIGLTGPESRLHIYGTDNQLAFQSQRSPYPKLSYSFSGTSAENFQFYDHHGSGRGFLYGRKYTTGTNPNANAGWHFYGNDTTLALRIDGSANVGIGTDSPDEKFHVMGNVKIGGANTYLSWNNSSRLIMKYDNSYRQGIHFEANSRLMRLFSTTNDSGGGIVFQTRAGSGGSDTDYGSERMRITSNGNVGIGESNPSNQKLDINGGGLYIRRSGTHSASRNHNANKWILLRRTGNRVAGEGPGISFQGSYYPTADYNNHLGMITCIPNPNDSYDLKARMHFYVNDGGGSSLGSNDIAGYFDYDSNGGQVNFTGQHRTFIKDIPTTQSELFEGLIVSANQNKYVKMNGGIEAGSNAVTINESLPIVSLSNVASDKKCFGVISYPENSETREDRYGRLFCRFKKEPGDTRVYINSAGEGAIWVTNINGNLESGDYITTSNVAGYGMRQDDDILHNYTVAKITMDCDFEPTTQPVQQIVRELSNVNYWVETTYTDVDLEEYSNLTEENRRTVTDNEIVTYQKIEREESKIEQEGWTLEVREELVNVLDEHDQLQWEDHPTDTEKAYKIRYLTGDGQITDEANAVHIAAFVGCTYHCG